MTYQNPCVYIANVRCIQQNNCLSFALHALSMQPVALLKISISIGQTWGIHANLSFYALLSILAKAMLSSNSQRIEYRKRWWLIERGSMLFIESDRILNDLC
ncbi:hypothetical protein BY458DRAFT_489317 [Sporodiniella umbellata]|nr:hypothetical protein BY458DRAFT_489317 [Sporodiniella umbellata]